VDGQESALLATDSAGNVIERYAYGDFGKPAFYDAFWNPVPQSAIGLAHLFLARRHEPELGWSDFLCRWLDHRAGVFVNASCGGTWANLANLGNASTFMANQPLNLKAMDGHSYRCLMTVRGGGPCRNVSCGWECVYMMGKHTTLFSSFEYDMCVCPDIDIELDGFTSRAGVKRYHAFGRVVDWIEAGGLCRWF
jgi:hypothetical protein